MQIKSYKDVRECKQDVTILTDGRAALLLLERPRLVNTNIRTSSVRRNERIYVCVKISQPPDGNSGSSKSICYFLVWVVVPSTFIPSTGMISYSTTSICTALSCINTGAVRVHLDSGADDKTDPTWAHGSSMVLRSTLRNKLRQKQKRCVHTMLRMTKRNGGKEKSRAPFAFPVRTRTDLPRRGSFESWLSILTRLVAIVMALPSF